MRFLKSITKPFTSAVKSIADIPGSAKQFVKNPINSIGTGIGSLYAVPGRAIGSDAVTDFGGKWGAITGGLLGGVNVGKAAGRVTGNERTGQVAGRVGNYAKGALGLAVGGAYLAPGLMAGGAAKAGMGYGAGSGLSAGAAGAKGLSLGGISSAGLGAGAASSAGYGAAGGLSLGGLSGAGMGAGAAKAGGVLSSLGLSGGGGVLGTGLSGGQAAMLGLAGTDMYMRKQQQQELRDLMERASREANPLKQEERFPYQQMLSDYMTGEQDITTQPIVRSELDFLQRQAQAQMARGGMTGSGNAGNIMTDYMLEGMNRTSQPYLNYLAGLGGFNQGVGNSGQIMANLGSQASAVPFGGLNSFGDAIGSIMYNERPWWSSANNAQVQMQGRGPTVRGVY